MLRTLFQHLLVTLQGYAQPYGRLLAEVVGKEGSLVKDTVQKQVEKLFLGPLEDLKKDGMSTSPNVIIVIDALDECFPEGDRKRVIEGIYDLKAVAPWLKFFMTSRPYGSIQSTFFQGGEENLKSIDLSEAQGASQDIQIYLNHCLLEVAKDKEAPFRPWPTEQQKSALFVKASGLFIWVSTMHKLLMKARNVEGSVTIHFAYGRTQHKWWSPHGIIQAVLHSACRH